MEVGVPLSSTLHKCLNRKYSLILTKIVMMLIILRSEVDAIFVKTLYLDNFVPEQSPAVHFVKEKIYLFSFDP